MDNIRTVYIKLIKNTLDRIMALFIFFIFWWVYIICAIILIVSDGFPIVFKQTRIGKNGKPFQCYKFRTMVKNADKIGPSYTCINDNRITKVGVFFRKTSLDEILQVYNVLKGDMSFVGYRPDVPREGHDYSKKKYLLKPGIVGLAQVKGRSLLTNKEKEYLENLYTETVSFKTDVYIIFKTIAVIFDTKKSN